MADKNQPGRGKVKAVEHGPAEMATVLDTYQQVVSESLEGSENLDGKF